MKILVALALLILGSTVDAFAQYGYRSYPGRWDAVQDNMEATSNNIDEMFGRFAVRMCEKNRGTGNLLEESYCYGRVRDNQGRIVGYNPRNVAAMEARTQRPILGPYQWGRRYTWDDPRYSWNRDRKSQDKHPEPKVDTAPGKPETAPAKQMYTFTNMTDCNLLIEKHVIKPGDSFTTSSYNPGVQAFSKTCIPELKEITRELTNVFCANQTQTAEKEGR